MNPVDPDPISVPEPKHWRQVSLAKSHSALLLVISETVIAAACVFVHS